MEQQSIIEQVNRLIAREKMRLKTKLLGFSVFLLISATLWLLMKLGHEYTAPMSYPVELTNPPEGFILVEGRSPQQIQLRVKAPGHTLLRYRLRRPAAPIRLSIEEHHAIGVGPNFYLPLRGYIPAIRNQLSQELELMGLGADSLRFQMAHEVSKRVPVRLNLQLGMDGQLIQSGPAIIVPDTVVLTGPTALLDTITHVPTAPLIISSMGPEHTYTLRLMPPPQVVIGERTVSVSVPVDRFTETSIPIAIAAINVPDSLQLVLLPETVQLSCNVAMGHYFSTTAAQFRIECDFEERSSVVEGKIRLRITQQPYYVSNVTFSPQFVDYFIKQR